MTAALSIVVMGLFFVVFGALRLGERAGGGCAGGHCDSCSLDCETEADRRLP
jgi:hypothetical protein